jgi:hypothetical protein
MASNRSLTIMLFVVSVVAALAIGAAAALWFTRSTEPVTPAQVAADPSAAPVGRAAGESVVIKKDVFINQVAATRAQLDELLQTYGAEPPPGRYWYDPISGLYGLWGHEAAGYIRPGHKFPPVPAEASNGSTGVFINGRQLNMNEAAYLQRIFGVVYQGRWWLDGQTGNLGAEGNPMPIANLVVAIQQAQRSAGGGKEYNYRDNLSGTSASSDGKCMWMNVPGSGSVMSGGC